MDTTPNKCPNQRQDVYIHLSLHNDKASIILYAGKENAEPVYSAVMNISIVRGII